MYAYIYIYVYMHTNTYTTLCSARFGPSPCFQPQAGLHPKGATIHKGCSGNQTLKSLNENGMVAKQGGLL